MKQENNNEYRDKGGRILKGGKWRSFNFIVEVAVESPKNVSEEEAAEDASDFMTAIGHTAMRVNESFVSIIRTDEYGVKRPKDAPVFIRAMPSENKVELKLPRGLAKKEQYSELMKEKPVKAKKATKANKKKAQKRI